MLGRLEVITRRAGFTTDAGRQVYLNEAPPLGPDDPEVAIAIAVNDDEPGHQAEKIVIRLPLEIHALARADLERPWLAVERVLGDIKRAMELPDRTVGGLVLRQFERGTTRTLEREEGSSTVGAAVTYIFPYAELWGAP